MDRPGVIVTYRTDEAERSLVEERLGRLVRLGFLKDLPREERASLLACAEIAIAWFPQREFPEESWSQLGGLRLLQLVSAGVDHLPFARLPAGLRIAANVGAYADPMAEHVLAMILGVYKNLCSRHAALAMGSFEQHLPNRMLKGSSCGILGYGGIGRATARLLKPFGVRILGVNSTGRGDEVADFCGTLEDLERVLGESDIVVIALPLTRTTAGLIGRKELSLMKEDGLLVNVARGEIVDQRALYAHLTAHPAFTAAIDAWWVEPQRQGRFELEHPFFDLPNVLGSPHNSGIVPGALMDGLRRAVENVERFLGGEEPRGVVRREEYLDPESRKDG
jgi:glycerate dehydrogenase